MRADLCAAMHQFIDQFKDMEGICFSKDETVNLKIVSLACMVAVGRCAIHRDRYSQAVSYQPCPREPPAWSSSSCRSGWEWRWRMGAPA